MTEHTGAHGIPQMMPSTPDALDPLEPDPDLPNYGASARARDEARRQYEQGLAYKASWNPPREGTN